MTGRSYHHLEISTMTSSRKAMSANSSRCPLDKATKRRSPGFHCLSFPLLRFYRARFSLFPGQNPYSGIVSVVSRIDGRVSPVSRDHNLNLDRNDAITLKRWRPECRTPRTSHQTGA